MLHANEVESYSDFKLNLTKRFNNLLKDLINKINSTIKIELTSNKFNMSLELSLLFDSAENILKYFMKQMKVLTLIETDKLVRDYIIIEILFRQDYLETLKEHMILCKENWKVLKYHWEISRSLNSIIHYVTTSIIYLCNKKDFDDKKLENYLSLFLFDEIMDLDLISETNEQVKESCDIYKNNLNLEKDNSHSIINKLAKTFYSICFDITKVITAENDLVDSIRANTSNQILFPKASQFYLLTLDFTILILLNHEIDHGLISVDFLQKLADDFNKYHSNSFFLNKVVKVFEIIIDNKLMIDKSAKALDISTSQVKSDACLYSNLLKSNVLTSLMKKINLGLFLKNEAKQYSNSNYCVLNSVHSFLIANIIKELTESNNSNQELNNELELKIESINSYKEIYNRVLTQDKQSLSDLKVTVDEVTKGIDKIDCKLFSIKYFYI